MTRLAWRFCPWGVAYGFIETDSAPVVTVNVNGSIWVGTAGKVELPKGMVLVDRQKRAIAELVYLHLTGEINLEELQP